MDIDDIRRANLRIIELELGSPTAAAKQVGMSRSQFINLRDGAKDSESGKPRGMRKGTARRIESMAGKDANWLDCDHGTSVTIIETSEDRNEQDMAEIRRLVAALEANNQKMMNAIMRAIDRIQTNGNNKQDQGSAMPGEPEPERPNFDREQQHGGKQRKHHQG